MSNPIREMFSNTEIYSGQWMPIYLETIPGSEERICAVIAVKGDDGDSKVIRTLHRKTISHLFGSQSKGINKAIDWIVQDIASKLQAPEMGLNDCLLPITGFVNGEIRESASQSLAGIAEKAAGLSTAVGGLHVDDEEKQKYFSTRLKESLVGINKKYSLFIDQTYKVHNRNVKFGIVTSGLIGQYHGIYSNTASFNSALAKMVALEDLKLEGILDQCATTREFFVARTEHGDKKTQDRLISDLNYELGKREIPMSTYSGPEELAEHLHGTLSLEALRLSGS